ncbi:MAG TPA: sulfatase, partial [Terriglobia bacterium]|nr:sulfatase [Terriglobia bacterium]
MDRRYFMNALCGAGVGLALRTSGGAETAKNRPPNVLFILPDEWRAQALGCMGNTEVHTPHLDRLASRGILFRNTLANTPVCCPARANILTGMYTSRNGMVANDLRLRESLATMSDSFRKAGYRTGYVGKWHLDGGPRSPGFIPPGPRRHGFDWWAANECNHNYFYNWYFRDANVPIITTQYEPEVWIELAIEFLYEAQSQGQPFFLMVGIGAPHDPYVIPEKYLEMYKPDALKMQPNWVPGVRGGSRKDIAAYYGAITAIDDQVGRLMSALEELGFEEDTIVLFSSDHGNMLGDHGKILKRKPWEESIRVPGILRYPRRVKSGQQKDALFSHVDIAPTLLALCGIPVPTEMQGTNLSSVVLGTSDQGPSSAFFQILGPYYAGGVLHAWRGVRTERYMYARTKSQPWLLYDLQEDPYELKNLINDPGASSVRENLENSLEGWMRKIEDSWALDWTVPVEDAGR